VYSLTRAVLANRFSRNAFFSYCVGLHVLVVVVLYWLATAEAILLGYLYTDFRMKRTLDGWQKDSRMFAVLVMIREL
jgi:hypothetical protein